MTTGIRPKLPVVMSFEPFPRSRANCRTRNGQQADSADVCPRVAVQTARSQNCSAMKTSTPISSTYEAPWALHHQPANRYLAQIVTFPLHVPNQDQAGFNALHPAPRMADEEFPPPSRNQLSASPPPGWR
jgi:hypothetical protein